MNLITVLIALGVEARFGHFDKYRNLVWFERYCNWLEVRLGGAAYWNGATGLLVTLFIPLVLLDSRFTWQQKSILYSALYFHFWFLVYSFGPRAEFSVNRYADALAVNDDKRLPGYPGTNPAGRYCRRSRQ